MEGDEVVADPVGRLSALVREATVEDVLEFFDALPPVQLHELTGAWRGSGIRTGHRLDGLLERFGWHGKRFESPDDVYPLVFSDDRGGLIDINPSYVPLSVVVRHVGLLHNSLAAGLFRLFRGFARTTRPRARVRMTEYRGVVSATMCYDALPIHDVFRKIDDDTLLGLMDLRGSSRPFSFVLRRESPVVRPSTV